MWTNCPDYHEVWHVIWLSLLFVPIEHAGEDIGHSNL